MLVLMESEIISSWIEEAYLYPTISQTQLQGKYKDGLQKEVLGIENEDIGMS